MKSLLGITVIALTAAALLLIVQGGTTSAQQPLPDNDTVTVTALPPLPPVHVCYEVQKGHEVQVDARLVTTNFGGDRVTIGRLVMMCELSTLKSPNATNPNPPPAADTRILACYSLRDGGNPDDPYQIETVFFKDSVIVGKSNLMCETAAKYVTDAAGNVHKFGTPSGNVRQCFDLGKGDDVGKPFVIANNNFGLDKVLIGSGIQMCEEAAKYRLINGVVDVTGFANGVVEECFRMRGNLDPRLPVVLETENFGRSEAMVRAARMICVPGEKSPIFTASIDTNREP
jgi:hypothetical protein